MHPTLPTPDQLSPEGIAFLKRCFTINAHLRPSATELEEDPWILDLKASLEAEEEEQSADSEVLL